MLWVFLMFWLPLLQYAYFGVKQTLLGHVRIIGVSALIFVITFIGCKIYTTTYFDHSPYWGVPVRGAQTQVITEIVDETVLLPEIRRLQREVQLLADQQKYLYGRLFNAMVELESKSKIEPALLARLGPMTNLGLRDFSKTEDAVIAASQYSANLPADSPTRYVMSDLQTHLHQKSKLQLEFLEKLGNWRMQQMEKFYEQTKIDYDAVIVTHVPDPLSPEYEDPNYVEPIPYVEPPRGNISDADGRLLWIAHKVMSDIDVVQGRMARTVIMIVKKHELLDEHNRQLSVEEQENASAVTFMFMQNKAKGLIEIGQPIYRCRVGLLWCSPVGVVKGLNTEAAQASHVTSGAIVNGFLVEVSLNKPKATRAEVLHVNHPIFD